jgi:hypothetical protein
MALAQQVQAQGRGDDTMLAHITPEEAALLKSRGGSGTINPITGLPEFNFFKKLWNGFKKVVKAVAPIIIPAIAIFAPHIIPAVGSWISGAALTSTTASVVGAAALSAGVTLASGGNLKQVLSSAALAGATTFLTPVIGKALSPTGASAITQGMIGSAAVGGGLAALRGGTVKEIIAAASTGAATAYLGNIARGAVEKINNMMQAGTIPATVTEKGAIDATHIAGDAANFKANGMTQQQVVAALKATGVNSIVAENAAQFTFAGDDASTVAANLAAGSPRGAYAGDANTRSVSSGNNVEVVQRMEDARFVAEDAAQLARQGLKAPAIVQNLVATGVSESVANTVANNAVRGLTADQMVNSIVSSSTFATSGKIFTNPQESVGRELGQVMTADQQKLFDALPFKDQINAGTLTIDQAAVLDNSGYKPADITNLTKLGYTSTDLVDMASTGVPASTLTSMANTKFAESTINSFFKAGASANDIATASNLVNSNKMSLATAETALRRDFDTNTLNSIANSRGATAATAEAVVNSKLSATTINRLASGGYDFNTAVAAANRGVDVNGMIERGDYTGYRAATTTSTQAPKPGQPAQPVAPADPYASAIQAGTVTAAEAGVLRANGYTATDVANLTRLGYSGADLVSMASTGVPASTLTSLANTQFAESQINNMFRAGASANDISTASNLVNANKLALGTAEKLLFKDLDSTTITNLTNRGAADIAANSTLTKTALTNAARSTMDLGKITALQAAGTDVESLLAKNDITAVTKLIADTPIVRDASGQYRVTSMDTLNQQFEAQQSGMFDQDIKFISQDAANLRAQGLNQTQIQQILMADGASQVVASRAASFASQGYTASNIESSLRTYGVNAVYPTATQEWFADNSASGQQMLSGTAADAKFVAADAKGLYDQGIRGSQLTDLLVASGVDPTVAVRATALASNPLNVIEQQLANVNRPLFTEPTLIASVEKFAPEKMIATRTADGKLGYYDPADGTVYDAQGNVVSQPTQPQQPGVETAGPGGQTTLARGTFTNRVGDNWTWDENKGVYYDPENRGYWGLDTNKGQSGFSFKGAFDSVDGTEPNDSIFPGPAEEATPGPAAPTQPLPPLPTPITPTTPGSIDQYPLPPTPEAPVGDISVPGPTYPVTPEVIDAANNTPDPIGAIADYVNTGVVPVPTPITPTTPTAPGTPTTPTPVAPTPVEPTAPGPGAELGGGPAILEPTPVEPVETAPTPTPPATPSNIPPALSWSPSVTPMYMPDGSVVYSTPYGTYTAEGGLLHPNPDWAAGQGGSTTPPIATTPPPAEVAPPAETPVAPPPVINQLPVPPIPVAPPAGPGDGTFMDKPGGVDYSITPPATTPPSTDMGGGTGIVVPPVAPGTGLGDGTTTGPGVPGGVDYGIGIGITPGLPGMGGGTGITPGTGPGLPDMGGGTGVGPGVGPGTGDGTTPGTGDDDVPEIVITAPREPVPPVVAPPVVAPPVVAPPATTPETDLDTDFPRRDVLPEPEVPPYVPLPDPVVPPDTWAGWGPVDPLSFKRLPDLKLPGLNPGWIMPEPYYQNTSPVQSKYYWGNRPYQPGPTFNQQLYDQVPAPQQPWGLQQMYSPIDLNQYLQQFSTVAGPISPK